MEDIKNVFAEFAQSIECPYLLKIVKCGKRVIMNCLK